MESSRSTSLRQRFPACSIVRTELRYNFPSVILLSLLLVALCPVVFGTANLEAAEAALPLEMFLSLLGIVLLTPVFLPENPTEIDDMVFSKYISPVKVWLVRLFSRISALAVLIGLFSLYLSANGCTVPVELVCGAFVSALFLGAVGMLSCAAFTNAAMAYMLPVACYAMNLVGGGKLGNFYLFSMTKSDFTPKPWLLASALVLFAAALAVRYLRRKVQ